MLPGPAAKHLILGLRLKLKGIDIIGTDNVSSLPYYNFEYNTTPLPERLSPSRDYFGYYNGNIPVYLTSGVSNPIDLNGFGMPLHTYTYANGGTVTYGVNMTPDINYLGAFNLKKIKNSFGGEIEFFYKDHNLYNPTNSYSNGSTPLPTNYQGDNANDGLCIDKITFRDGFNTDNNTETRYEFSDGQRFFRGGYFWQYEYTPPAYGQIGYNPNPDHAGTVNYFNDYITPLMLVNGSNHGYTYATVKNYGYNNEFLGSVKYKFSNLIDEDGISNLSMPISLIRHAHHPIYFYDYKMGLPLEMSSYDINGDLVAKTTNSFAVNAAPYGYTRKYMNGRTTKEGTAATDNYADLTSVKMGKVSSTVTKYAGANQISETITYAYDKNDNLTSASWTDANGDVNTKKFYYNYTEINGQPLIANSIFSVAKQYLLRTEIWKNTSGADYILTANYATPPGPGYGNNNYMSLKTNQPVSFAQYSSSNFWTNMVTQDKYYLFDDKANVIETKYENGASYSAAIWDTRIEQKIADVSNAKYDQVAYTSFEGAYGAQGVFEYSKGNWDFNPSGIVYSFTSGLVRPLTGRYHYQLNSSNTITSFNPLQADTKYVLTFWATSSPVIQSGTQTFVAQQVGEKQSWKLYSVVLAGNGQPVTLSAGSATIHIDELRLHPLGAAMSTATYEPLFGVGSQNDARNNITYYEYDVMGNVKLTRDVNGNIRSLNKQVIQGIDN